jgi:heme-degrading monooxygenase HmoA
MYIAMNRFRVATGGGVEFERIWAERETHLGAVPGFMEFHLLRGPEAEDHTLYASHTLWRSRDDFEAWTKSDAFRQAHANAANTAKGGGGASKSLYLGPPQFEGFEAIQVVKPD